MEIKILLLFVVVVGVVAPEPDHPSFESGSDSNSSESSEESTETPQIPMETEPDTKKDYFINKVHSIASNISKNLIIHDNKVVWSPFIVVNALALLSNEDAELVNGFESAWKYLTHENPLNSTQISLGYSKNPEFLSKNFTNLKMAPFPEHQSINELLQEAFLNVTNFGNHGNLSTETEEKSLINTTDTILLTGLGVESLWATPFHPRYAKKSRFYLNSTHVVKAKFMNNIGFFKYAELEELDAVAVAMPMKNSPRTYGIFIKPNNPDNLELLNSKFENLTNFTDIFAKKFKTRRVQMALPRVEIDSQFPIPLPSQQNSTLSTLHISSLLISYTGLYNHFHHPHHSHTHSQTPIRFTRLRRRPDDVKFQLNTPFLFHLYDDGFSGFLLSGLILNPLSNGALSNSEDKKDFPHELKIAKETANFNCLERFHSNRKIRGIYENLNVRCHSDNFNYSEILNEGKSGRGFNLTIEKNPVDKKFFRNEVDFKEVAMGETVARVKYGSFGELFDGRVVVLRNPTHSLYIFYPNERSGLSRIEETLETVSISSLKCQLRDMTVRLRLPWLREDKTGVEVGFEKIAKKKNVLDLVPIERTGRKSSPKRYRQLTVDRGFVWVLMEEEVTGGGLVGVGRVVEV